MATDLKREDAVYGEWLRKQPPLHTARLDELQLLVGVHSTAELGQWPTFVALIRAAGYDDIFPEGIHRV